MESIVGREKIDQAAIWLSATVSSAFFTSLERFSCVNVTTDDSDDETDDDVQVQVRTDKPRTQNDDVAELPV